MPGSKFDSVLKIVDGRISPSGVLALEPDEDVTKLYAWVVQIGEANGTGAACIAFQEAGGFPSRDKWTTRGDAINEGAFRPGLAFAMAVTVSIVKRPTEAAGQQPMEGDNPPPAVLASIYDQLGEQVDGSTRVYWWSETLLLTP